MLNRSISRWMLTFAFAAGLLVLGVPQSADAQDLPADIGVGIGSATGASGVSFKTSLGGTSSFQGVAGTWYGWAGRYRFGTGNLAVAGDYLMEMPSLAGGSGLDLRWNYGFGGGVGFGNFGGVGLGASGVLGLVFDFSPSDVPLDLALEYRPGIYFINSFTYFSPVNFSGHLRVWF